MIVESSSRKVTGFLQVVASIKMIKNGGPVSYPLVWSL